MEIVDYSEKAILVKGENTKKYIVELKELGGKWNRTLGGWIFSKKKKGDIEKILGTNPCKKYEKIKNIERVVSDTKKFCSILSEDNVKDISSHFNKLPDIVKCMFVQNAFTVLQNKKKYTNSNYLTCFKIFRIFEKDFENDLLAGLENIEEVYENAKNWYNGDDEKEEEKKPSRKPSSRGTKYDIEHQRYASPEEGSPLYIFYTTLYNERPKSRLAITWLTEHGLLDGDERKKLIVEYKKLENKNRLVK